jgi:hypothetical protein
MGDPQRTRTVAVFDGSLAKRRGADAGLHRVKGQTTAINGTPTSTTMIDSGSPSRQ